MKTLHLYLLISLTPLIPLVSCKKEPCTNCEIDSVTENFENNELQQLTLTIENMNIQFEENFSICLNPESLNVESGSGTNFPLYAKRGVDFFGSNERTNTLRTNIHFQNDTIGFVSFSPLEFLKNLCDENPENCRGYVVLELDNEIFISHNLGLQREEVYQLDENAITSFEFSDEILRMECFENIKYIPVEFNYTGYLYNTELSDSLFVSALETNFIVVGD